jgi:hypothetical protein
VLPYAKVKRRLLKTAGPSGHAATEGDGALAAGLRKTFFDAFRFVPAFLGPSRTEKGKSTVFDAASKK